MRSRAFSFLKENLLFTGLQLTAICLELFLIFTTFSLSNCLTGYDTI